MESASIEMDESDEKEENSPSSGTSIRRNGTMFNLFAVKKAAAQGLMDVALMTSNANQLRYLIEFSPRTATFHCLFLLILLSLLIQVIVGIILIMKGRSDFRRRSNFRREKSQRDIHLNQCVGVGVFLIIVVNVLIAAFSANVSSSQVQPVSPV